MPKKGAAYTSPPKRFMVPADIPPLQNHGKLITNAMRATHAHRMREVNKK